MIMLGDDDQRDKLIQEFGSGTSVQRYKGLGEMNAEQLWNTTMDPDRRTLRKVTYDPEDKKQIKFLQC